MIDIDQWSDEQVTRFTREQLGCGCPDEVFEQIERSTPRPGCHALLIGRRLLIHLYEMDGAPTKEQLYAMVERGRGERDRNDYNRFRLVLIGFLDDEEREKIVSEFNTIAENDDTIHLHLINSDPFNIGDATQDMYKINPE